MPRDPDDYIRNVRATVATWKQTQLLDSLQDDQDTTKLNGYLKLTALAHQMLKDYVTSNKSQSDPLLRDIVNAIGPISGLTSEELMLLEDSLFRDLVEYPFKYNTNLINSFEKRNTFNRKIVPNK
jgi:hypothetical protein